MKAPLKPHPQYRQVIVENTTNPGHLVTTPPLNTVRMKVHASLCSELYDLFIEFKNHDFIVRASWKGHGCLVSKAAINILCSRITNKSVSDALAIIKNYKAMLFKKKFDRSLVKDLIVFENVLDFQNRVSCALLGANGFEEMILATDR